MNRSSVAHTVTPEYDASGAMDIQAMRQKLVDMLQTTRQAKVVPLSYAAVMRLRRKPARRRKPATSRRKH